MLSIFGHMRHNLSPDAPYNNGLPTVWKDTRTILLAGIAERDSVKISKEGMRLLIDGKTVGEKENWDRLTSGTDDKTMQAIDRHVAIAGQYLKQMNQLAENAMDESLDDETRMELQLEIERLQFEMDTETVVLWYVAIGGMSEDEAVKEANSGRGSFFDTDSYKMLEFSYDRLLGGLDWDVRAIMANGKWDVLDTEIADPNNVPTVGEILRAKSRSVMNSQEAAKSKKEIEKSLDKLVAFKNQFATSLETNKKNKNSLENPNTTITMSNTPIILARTATDILRSFAKAMDYTNTSPQYWETQDGHRDYFIFKYKKNEVFTEKPSGLTPKNITDKPTIPMNGYVNISGLPIEPSLLVYA